MKSKVETCFVYYVVRIAAINTTMKADGAFEEICFPPPTDRNPSRTDIAVCHLVVGETKW